MYENERASGILALIEFSLIQSSLNRFIFMQEVPLIAIGVVGKGQCFVVTIFFSLTYSS